MNSRCDSVIIKLHATKAEYKVIFNDTIANLRSNSLFYPDIKYLPYKIFGIGPNKNTLTLEEIIYGKTSIDSLLQLYDYKGYTQITDQEFSPVDSQIVLDLLDKLKAKE